MMVWIVIVLLALSQLALAYSQYKLGKAVQMIIDHLYEKVE